MAFMRITIIPVGTKEISISDHIAEVIQVLKTEEANYTITDMGTIVEGEPKFLFSVAEKMHGALFDRGIMRVITSLEIDDRRDKKVRLKDKVKSVKNKLY